MGFGGGKFMGNQMTREDYENYLRNSSPLGRAMDRYADTPGINLIGGEFGNGIQTASREAHLLNNTLGPMLGPWQQPDWAQTKVNTGGMSLDSIDRTGPKKNGGRVDSLLQRYGIPSFLGTPREPINREFDIPEGSFPTPGEPDYFPPDEELV